MRQKSSLGLQYSSQIERLVTKTAWKLFVSLTWHHNGAIEETREVHAVWLWNQRAELKLAPETRVLINGVELVIMRVKQANLLIPSW